jgi:hypothetical protein
MSELTIQTDCWHIMSKAGSGAGATTAACLCVSISRYPREDKNSFNGEKQAA